MTVASILPSHLMSHGKVLCRSKIGFDNTNALAYIITNIGKPIGADRKVLVHRNGVGIPRHFFIYIAPKRGISMSEKILSCFIDEAGDFGEYDYHSPYYIVSVVLHEQSLPIQNQIDGLERYLTNLGYPNHALHTGPLIRREGDYKEMLMEDRKKLFNLLFRFARKLPIRFFSAKVKKSECKDSDELESKLTKAITNELQKHDDYFRSFDKIIIYYDNGQKPLKRILNIIFSSRFSDIEVRRVRPVDYKLFQVADLICTLEHIYVKIELGLFSNSEKEFFSRPHDFKRDYWRKIENQQL